MTADAGGEPTDRPGGEAELPGRVRSLVGELQHRTRNLLALVQILAEETSRSSAAPPAFYEKFSRRLAALSRAQGLLSRLDEGGQVGFGELLAMELDAFGGPDARLRERSVTLRGPDDAWIRASVIQILVLAIHELAANAATHGALSQPAARLDVAWSVKPSDRRGAVLRVEWVETGVALAPARQAPAGFGRELVEEALRFQLGAQVDYSLEADGVRCVFTLPLSRLVDPAPDRTA